MKIREKDTRRIRGIDMDKFQATDLCYGVYCSECPVRDLVDESDQSTCVEWMKENMDKALELLGWERVDEKMNEVEEKACETGESVWVKNGEKKLISRTDFPAMSELCEGFMCSDCPVWKQWEKSGYNSCREWLLKNWDEGLRMLGWEKVESLEQKESQEAQEPDYFLMRHLGVGYRERFYVDGTEGVYYVGVAGRLFRVYDGEEARKREIEAGQVLYLLLEHPERVRKIELTEEHREYLEAVKRVFPEVGWVKREGGWLLFGDASVVLLSREEKGWDELEEGEKVEVEKLLEME